MGFRLLLGHPTQRGPVFIAQGPDGRFHVWWKGDSLGAYASVVAAIDDVAGGHTYSPPDGTDFSALGISADVGDWLPAGDCQ